MELHSTYAELGLRILGFPCNQFGNQVSLDFVSCYKVSRKKVLLFLFCVFIADWRSVALPICLSVCFSFFFPPVSPKRLKEYMLFECLTSTTRRHFPFPTKINGTTCQT